MKTKRSDIVAQLRGLTTSQILGKITDSQKKLVTLQQDKTLGKLKNVHELTSVRKFIARAMTILDEKITTEIK